MELDPILNPAFSLRENSTLSVRFQKCPRLNVFAQIPQNGKNSISSIVL